MPWLFTTTTTTIIIIISICLGGSNCGRVVEYLPGFEGPLPFHLETGYLGVDKNEDVQLFYYFVQSESNPKEDPLIMWLTGGPGCSAIDGLLYEIGPIEFQDVHDGDVQYNGSLPALTLRSTSWTKMANIIFVDGPVGTGFSYARTPDVSYSTDIQFCDQVYEFMRKWLKTHMDFISNPFYVGGDSYSGVPIPIITQLISSGNEADIVPYINLKGYIIGNPFTTPDYENYRIHFANGIGLISNERYKSFLESCDGEYRPDYTDSDNIQCLQNLEWFNECIDGINCEQVLEPCYQHDSSIKLPSQMRVKEKYACSERCPNQGYSLVFYWANDDSVRQALHIQQGTIGEWLRCNRDVNFSSAIDDVRPYHINISHKGYRSLIYSGDHDMIIPHQSTEEWIKELNYSLVDQWRSWKLHGQIAGYTESYSNMMTYATIKGAGHVAPEYKPRECFAMFKRWISYQPL